MLLVEERNANYSEPLELAVDRMLQRLRERRSQVEQAIREFETQLYGTRPSAPTPAAR